MHRESTSSNGGANTDGNAEKETFARIAPPTNQNATKLNRNILPKIKEDQHELQFHPGGTFLPIDDNWR
jgi:hypothetical protein